MMNTGERARALLNAVDRCTEAQRMHRPKPVLNWIMGTLGVSAIVVMLTMIIGDLLR